MLKLFTELLLCLRERENVLRNFDDSTKLFSGLYLAKFLDTSAKSFFPYSSSKKLNSFQIPKGGTIFHVDMRLSTRESCSRRRRQTDGQFAI